MNSGIKGCILMGDGSTRSIISNMLDCDILINKLFAYISESLCMTGMWYIYIYIYIYMRKIDGKVDKPNTDNRFSNDISFLL